MIGRQVRIIATMLLGAILIAAGILFFFPAHAGATQWGTYTKCHGAKLPRTSTPAAEGRVIVEPTPLLALSANLSPGA
jgi:hypothetical protein